MITILNRRLAIQYKYPDLVHEVDYEEVNWDRPEGTFTWTNTKYPEPTDANIILWISDAIASNDRRNAYNAAGLTESRLIELWIEDDPVKIAKARSDRQKIRIAIPKGE